jgi:hypothetical protein
MFVTSRFLDSWSDFTDLAAVGGVAGLEGFRRFAADGKAAETGRPVSGNTSVDEFDGHEQG